MATLKYIRESKDSHLLSLGIEGEESVRYTVTRSVYESMGSPAVGEWLTNDQLSFLTEEDRLCKARQKALSLLSFADNNKRTLTAKLLRAGFDRETAERVCSEMTDYGYIDEKRQLERLILIEANTKLRGPIRILPALAAKGFSSSDIREVMGELVDSGEIDFRENAKALIQKKQLEDDPEQIKKLLYKNGFKND